METASAAPRIKIASDEIHPVRATGNAYLPRSGRRASTSLSVRSDVEGAFKLREGDQREGNVEGRQEYKGWVLAWLAYQSTGVIYGDIGTSPLYVFSSTFLSPPSYDDLLGVLSIIIWTLFLVVTVKYVCIVLLADDDGEGGTFALYSLLSRFVRVSRSCCRSPVLTSIQANITKRDPKASNMVKMERYLSSDMKPTSKTARSFLERYRWPKVMLKIVGVAGVSLIMADGVLTPAQSVLGAIQGISVVQPNITSGTVVGATCAILIALFIVQPFGTTKIASTFAPIVIVWLLFNFSFGIYVSLSLLHQRRP